MSQAEQSITQCANSILQMLLRKPKPNGRKDVFELTKKTIPLLTEGQQQQVAIRAFVAYTALTGAK